MKYYYYLLITMVFIPFSIQNINAAVDEAEIKDKLSMLLGQNNAGTDYWFTIPPAYEDESAGYDNFIKVLIASPVETDVTVSVPGKGFNKTKTTIADNVIEFNLNPALAQPILHSGREDKARPAKVYKGAGIHVSSNSPVIVYVVVRYKYTSDGFLAIPSSALGTHYINMVYQEPALWNNGWFNPFSGVTAAYDNTEINFTMGGGPEGIDAVPLEGGQLIHTGESTSQSLDQGDVWLLSINGQKQDLSGSIFTGNKPFSLVSGLNCANFPLANPSCDYSVEMELPVYSWGTKYYISPMKSRLYNGLIRVFASQDDTKIYRDNELIGNIAKGGGATFGEGYLEFRLWPKKDEMNVDIPPHIATIHSDKPISVMYYNPGAKEDNGQNSNTDPFMMTFTPVEQFGHQIYFASPNSTGGADPFPNNYVNIVFENNGNEIPDDLLFAELSKPNPIWKKVKDLFGSEFENFIVPFNNNTFSTKTLSLDTEGVYGLKSSQTLFGAYSFGFGPYDSYGYPTAAIFKDIQFFDSKAPDVTFTGENDDDYISGTVDDSHDGSSGLAQFYLIQDLSSNYNLKITSVDEGSAQNSSNQNIFIPGITKKINWTLEKADVSKDGNAVIYLTDRSGNDELLFFGNLSSQTSITSEQTLSEYMIVTQSEISILPKAVSEGFTELTIFNLEGNKVHNSKTTLSRVSLTDLLSGTYIITLRSDDRLLTRKLSIVK